MESIRLRGNGGKKFFALTLLWMATAFVASAQTITTLQSFTFDDGANPNLVTPMQGDVAIFTRPHVHRRFENLNVFAGPPSK